MAFSDIMDPVLRPILSLNPLFAIMLISFLIALLIVLIYRKFTDQELMKRLKKEIKEYQTEMKKLKDKPKKMMEMQKKAMETNTKYMMHSFKPTLITFLPIILIFGWLNANMAYYPLIEDTQFSITAEFEEGTAGLITLKSPDGVNILGGAQKDILNSKAEWVLTGEAGDYSVSYEFGDQIFDHSLIIAQNSKDRRYAKPQLRPADFNLKDTQLKEIVVSNKKVKPLQQIPLIKSIPWIGNFGWLGTYILFSILFSITLRRILKVY